VEKSDKRYVSTHNKIKKTFEQLVLTHAYGDITVSMLVREVGINRKTFYLHYPSLEALMDELVESIAEEIVTYLQLQKLHFTQDSLEGYLQMLAQNLPLHKRLICSEEYYFVFQRVCDTVTQRRLEQTKQLHALGDFRMRAAIGAVSLVVMQTYRSWLLEEMPISTRELAVLINQLLKENIITMVKEQG